MCQRDFTRANVHGLEGFMNEALAFALLQFAGFWHAHQAHLKIVNKGRLQAFLCCQSNKWYVVEQEWYNENIVPHKLILLFARKHQELCASKQIPIDEEEARFTGVHAIRSSLYEPLPQYLQVPHNKRRNKVAQSH